MANCRRREISFCNESSYNNIFSGCQPCQAVLWRVHQRLLAKWVRWWRVNIGLLAIKPPDAVISPRLFYWIQTPWKFYIDNHDLTDKTTARNLQIRSIDSDEGIWENGGIAPRFLRLDTRRNWAVRFINTPPALPPGKSLPSHYPLNKWLGEPFLTVPYESCKFASSDILRIWVLVGAHGYCVCVCVWAAGSHRPCRWQRRHDTKHYLVCLLITKITQFWVGFGK